MKSSGTAKRYARLLARIGDDVEFGAHEPGRWLKLIDLQHRYGATQFEVRRVLHEMSSNGLVEHRPNYGFRVAGPDPAKRDEIVYVRLTLERSAARLIVENATPRDMVELGMLADAFERSIASRGRHAQATANRAFHERLYTTSRNTVLAELIGQLRERYYGTTGRWRDEEGLHSSSDDHRRMIQAIRRRDREGLERLIGDHILSFTKDETAKRKVRNDGSDAGPHRRVSARLATSASRRRA